MKMSCADQLPSSAPLSAGQGRLWFLQQLDPDSPAYNIAHIVWLHGVLDATLLQQSVDSVVSRHAALRTVFQSIDGEPRRVQGKAPAVAFVDVGARLEADKRAEVRKLARAAAQKAFDLAGEPPCRFVLARLDETHHALIFVVHHIACDPPSIRLVLDAIAADYDAAVAGEDLQVFDPGAREGFQEAVDLEAGTSNAESLDYWVHKLRGVPEPEQLPIGWGASGEVGRSAAGSNTPFDFGSEWSGAVTELAQAERATAYVIAVAAFKVLLSRYTGRKDVVVGTFFSTRDRPELSDAVGFFVETIVLRTDLAACRTFRDVVRAVRTSFVEAYEHRDVPFDKLVEELKPRRVPGTTPFFSIAFTMGGKSPVPPAVAGIVVEVEEIENGASPFDLDLFVDVEESVHGSVTFSDRYDEQAIRRMIAHYGTLLSAAVSQPDAALEELPVVTPGEVALLGGWNATGVEFGGGVLVHELVSEQVARTPDRVALRFGGEGLSFRELDERSARVARLLGDSGVGPESRVAVCVERSFDLVVALLGVLKAGAAYVPLDPGYPAERLEYMFQDSGASVVLTQESLLGRVRGFGGSVVCLDRDWPLIAALPAQAPRVRVHPDNLAYVIYTSGSTGRPKGSMNTHRNVVNFLNHMQRLYDLDGHDTVLQRTPTSFDVSVWELFWPLSVGARLVLARPRGDQDPEYLSSLIDAEGVTVAHFVPSAFGPFLDSRTPASSGSLRKVMCSGEALSPQLRDRALGELTAIDLHDLYGPTEAAVDVTAWQCTMEDGSSAPIGRPFANTTVHVLDADMLPTGVGIPGELYIGGVQVSRGYLNRAGLTAERFVPDTGGATGAVLYRTGDLAVWREDGVLEYLGRLDHQVKIRGFRIEVAEIEAALAEVAGVREAAVVAVDAGTQHARLAAYVTPLSPGGKLDPEVLRTALARTLPDYMVPSFFTVMEALPRTPSDKLDRKALPKPQFTRAVATEFVGPRSATEHQVAAIWRQVLGAAEIGVDDDFFALGGQSLMAVRVVTACRSGFGVDLPIRSFFEDPTVAALAYRIDTLVAIGQESDEIMPVSGDRARGGVLSFEQVRLWFLQQLDQHNPFYNVSHLAELTGELDFDRFSSALDSLVERHEILRTTYAMVDGSPVQRVRPAGPIQLGTVDLRGHPLVERPGRVQDVVREETRRPFDLETGPVVRATLIRAGEREHLLLLVTPHIASDAASYGILLDDLGALYAGRTLPPLSIQYLDYAAWQRDRSEGGAYAAELAYWQKHLDGAPAYLELPGDRLRPAYPSYEGGLYRFSLPKTVLDRFHELAAHMQASMFMTVLAAFQIFLARQSGQTDLVVGVPMTVRTRAELDRLVGCFLNSLALRVDLSGDPTFRGAVARARKSSLGGFQHQSLPFERLVEVMDPPRDTSRNPVFQVMFVYQEAGTVRRFGGLEMTDRLVYNDTAKLDLTLFVDESPDSLGCSIEYAKDLFSAETISLFAERFQTLVESLLDDIDTPMSQIQSISPGEVALLGGWNATGVEFGGGVLVHELVSEQVARTPDRVALRFGGEGLSFRELDERSARVARLLGDSGVGPESRVAVCVERSFDLVVALLGVLKAGAAYVPLDPGYPAERLEYMFQDSGASVVLTQESLLGRVRGFGGSVVCLDRDWPLIAALPAQAPRVRVHPDNLAYVIYTSGSTGRPKGSMNTHRNVVNLIRSFQEEPGLSADDRLTAITTVSFDIAGLELFLPLAVGGTLVLAAAAEVLDPKELGALMDREESTVLQATPTVWRLLIESGWRGRPGMQAWTGGEALPAAVAEALIRLGLRVWNVYGPTETTIWSSRGAVTGRETGVGTPIANTAIYVLDPWGMPSPVGVRGEVAIAGTGLARGYLGRAGLTADRFVPDPTGAGGGRLYRTGDVGRWTAQGRLELFGRRDDQVKVRGMRIELGEVEHALGSHPNVTAVAAAVVSDRGENELAAFLVLREREGRAGDLAEIRDYAARSLPAQYLPSRLAVVDELPRTPNGKTDRKALSVGADFKPSAVKTAAPSTGPSEPLEPAVAKVWCELLGLGSVGVHDNFFDVGGHSLLVIRLHARLAETSGWPGSVVDLFQFPTVASQARFIAGRESSDAADPALEAARVSAGRDRLRRRLDARRPA
ncbi:amino acid adenylation domain-containing protein [Catenulispora sp. EB89]|uniref:amino acid adenylation domain-containing protein n=1 Tax=Catenulispora sp. EB89 TaxID=3156257 RepID=UPI00351246D3